MLARDFEHCHFLLSSALAAPSRPAPLPVPLRLASFRFSSRLASSLILSPSRSSPCLSPRSVSSRLPCRSVAPWPLSSPRLPCRGAGCGAERSVEIRCISCPLSISVVLLRRAKLSPSIVSPCGEIGEEGGSCPCRLHVCAVSAQRGNLYTFLWKIA